MFNLFNLVAPDTQKEKAPLSDSSKQLLSQQVFSTHQPNAIVQDFETFIEFLQLHKVEVSANQNAIAPKYLADLNERLSHPVKIDFLRCSQKSYPNIHGLYLLLRASAIAQVKSDKKKNILQIEPRVFQSWQELNDTEKYLNLLATWIFYASEGIMDSSSRSFNEWWYVFNCWKDLPKQGLSFTSSLDEHWLRRLKLHNLALLNLFGFIEVEDAQPLKGKGWQVIDVKPLPFGSSIMELLRATNWERGLDLDDDFLEPFEEKKSLGIDVVVQKSTPTEILQEEFQALDLFPAWENNLQLPDSESKDGIFVFKVSLKAVWRKIAIPSSLTLYSLSSAILDAFDFDNDHLHQFTYKNRQGVKENISHPDCEEPSFTDEVLLRDWQINIGDRITYVFDFGDWWEFNVVLESIEEPDPTIENPKLIEQKGKSPKQY